MRYNLYIYPPPTYISTHPSSSIHGMNIPIKVPAHFGCSSVYILSVNSGKLPEKQERMSVTDASTEAAWLR